MNDVPEYVIPVREKELTEEEETWLQEQGAFKLVRCRDCNKRGQFVYRVDGTEYIMCWNQRLGIQHPIDWFCADGKRKET